MPKTMITAEEETTEEEEDDLLHLFMIYSSVTLIRYIHCDNLY